MPLRRVVHPDRKTARRRQGSPALPGRRSRPPGPYRRCASPGRPVVVLAPVEPVHAARPGLLEGHARQPTSKQRPRRLQMLENSIETSLALRPGTTRRAKGRSATVVATAPARGSSAQQSKQPHEYGEQDRNHRTSPLLRHESHHTAPSRAFHSCVGAVGTGLTHGASENVAAPVDLAPGATLPHPGAPLCGGHWCAVAPPLECRSRPDLVIRSL